MRKYDFVIRISKDEFKIFYNKKNQIKFLNFNFPNEIIEFTDRMNYLKDNLLKILKENRIKAKRVKILIDEDDNFFYTTTFPITPEEEFKNIVNFELKKYFKNIEFVGDYLLLNIEKNQKIAVVCGIKSIYFEFLKSIFKDMKLEIEFISFPFDPIFSLFANFYKEGSYFVINFSFCWTYFLYINNGKLIYVRGAKNISLNWLIDIISREFLISRENVKGKFESMPLFEDKEYFFRVRSFFEDFIKEINVT
ncbi:MAG: hypothetical protein ACPLZ9_04635, partial [Candidatus Ratteibacteria bacterium]